ncbi:YeeE/YedE family protein [Microlunatus soli]|uniref:Uncharacterized protein n=1 Tax=Microlunatus soli TaxID=630515 RepID=A0A1H1MQF0_9ACTN|nr:YeeE/YedE family protein [Microlunatus soli]SDR89093.1 hypothetical protein SAMN04489812_0224 [Microlunatus soli]
MTSLLDHPLISRVTTPGLTSQAPPRPAAAGPVKRVPLIIAAILGIGLIIWVGTQHGAKYAALLSVGLLLGFALFHSRFGFTSAWRQLLAVGNSAGLRAHTLLIGTAASVVMLIAASGIGLFGSTPVVKATPIGLPLFVGAALFAIGMQLGGACASGTLFAVGSGQSAILITLFGFIVGSVIYTAVYPAVQNWPEIPGVLLSDHVTWFGSWAITIAALIAIAVIARRVQNRRTPPPTGAAPSATGAARIIRGSWPLLVGAVVLGLLAGAVLLVSGSTWGVTFAFALWGAKFLQLIGLHPETWAFWQEAKNAQALSASAWTDKTTLTDVGIMIGAALASALAGAWTLRASIPWRTVVAAILGGICMGFGARLAGGCNIGAYLSGISVGNLSGWIWAVFALGGTWVGLKLRPLFGLGNPAPTDSIC